MKMSFLLSEMDDEEIPNHTITYTDVDLDINYKIECNYSMDEPSIVANKIEGQVVKMEIVNKMKY